MNSLLALLMKFLWSPERGLTCALQVALGIPPLISLAGPEHGSPLAWDMAPRPVLGWSHSPPKGTVAHPLGSHTALVLYYLFLKLF